MRRPRLRPHASAGRVIRALGPTILAWSKAHLTPDGPEAAGLLALTRRYPGEFQWRCVRGRGGGGGRGALHDRRLWPFHQDGVATSVRNWRGVRMVMPR